MSLLKKSGEMGLMKKVVKWVWGRNGFEEESGEMGLGKKWV
jgi:hypothetical protein